MPSESNRQITANTVLKHLEESEVVGETGRKKKNPEYHMIDYKTYN